MTASTHDSDGSSLPISMATDWTASLVIGLVTAVMGIIVLVWPSETLVVVSVLFGIQLIVFGVYRLIRAFADDVPNAGLLGFVGIIGILAGVIVLRHPFETVAFLAIVLGAVWIVFGSIDIIGAMADRDTSDRWWSALFGLVTLAAGVVVVAWPDITVTVIAWIAGLYLTVAGVLMVVVSVQARRAGR